MAMPDNGDGNADKEDGDIIRKWDIHRITASLIVEPWGAFAFIQNLKIDFYSGTFFSELRFVATVTTGGRVKFVPVV